MYKSEVKGKGGIRARVVADSISNGIRLTTMEIRFHRYILPEFNTHRMFSRNFSSSRAIPVAKMLEQVENDPAMPIHWGKNQAGMQASEECDNLVDGREKEWHWRNIAKISSHYAEEMDEAGYHKQIVNRLIEPFQFVNGVVTATEWDNFFALRDHRDAQPEIAELAKCMKQAMAESEPDKLEVGEWHLPYVVGNDNLNFVMSKYITRESMLQDKIKCSAARAARVSYMKHDNTAPSVADDIELYNMLVTRPYTDKRGTVFGENDPIHASPVEHCGTPMNYLHGFEDIEQIKYQRGVTHVDIYGTAWSGNMKGWIQARQLIQNA